MVYYLARIESYFVYIKRNLERLASLKRYNKLYKKLYKELIEIKREILKLRREILELKIYMGKGNIMNKEIKRDKVKSEVRNFITILVTMLKMLKKLVGWLNK